MNQKIELKRMSENAIMPRRENETDSGYDLYTSHEVVIDSQDTLIVPTDIAISLPYGYEAQVRPRSGFTAKTRLRVQLGTIDQTYHKRIGVIVDNIGYEPITIEKHTRIAQLVFVKQDYPDLIEVDTFEQTSDRGGFGSTGTK